MRSAIIYLLLLPAVAFSDAATEVFCQETSQIAAEMQSQLPIHKDAGTIWIGFSAALLDGTCHVRHEYLVRSEVVADMVVKGSGQDVTHEMVDGWLLTDEARDSVRATMREKLRKDLSDMLMIPGVVYIARVQTSGPLQPFNVEIRTGTAL